MSVQTSQQPTRTSTALTVLVIALLLIATFTLLSAPYVAVGAAGSAAVVAGASQSRVPRAAIWAAVVVLVLAVALLYLGIDPGTEPVTTRVTGTPAGSGS